LEGDRLVGTLVKRKFAVIAVTAVLILCVTSQIALVAANPAYQDEFSSTTLQSYWTFSTGASPNAGTYSLPDSNHLRLTPTIGAAFAPTSNFNAPKVLQSVTGDFVATTYVSGLVYGEDGNRAGILLYKDNSNYIRVEKWSKTQVQTYAVIAGTGLSTPVNGLTSSTSMYLKVDKTGTSVKAYYSTTGADGSWVLISTTTFSSSDPLKIGLYAINVGTAAFTAEFDYFHITPYSTLSVLPEYPVGIFGAAAAIAGGYVFFKAKTKAKPISF
jgi:regulation of enolase protein 1 (concanavalin A-like superfamily)